MNGLHNGAVSDIPAWSVALDAAANATTAAALIVGGTIGYVRYLRGRVFHAKLDLDLEVELCLVDSGQPALKVVATIKNEGTCRVAFQPDQVQEVQVSVCYPVPWRRALTGLGSPEWSLYFSEPFSGNGQDQVGVPELEPGQRAVRQLLVPGVERPQPVAYRVRLYVEGSPHPVFRYVDHDPWSTERVIEVVQDGG